MEIARGGVADKPCGQTARSSFCKTEPSGKLSVDEGVEVVGEQPSSEGCVPDVGLASSTMEATIVRVIVVLPSELS